MPPEEKGKEPAGEGTKWSEFRFEPLSTREIVFIARTIKISL
jgi:hypothetical protein